METEDAANPPSDDTNWSPIPGMRGGTDEEGSANEEEEVREEDSGENETE